MVSKYIKLTTFNKMPKMLNSKVDGEQLSIKCAVSRLRWSQFLGEECNGLPCIPNLLLEYHSDREIGGVGHDVGWSVRFWVSEEGGISEGFFDCGEGGGGLLIPRQLACLTSSNSQQPIKWLQHSLG